MLNYLFALLLFEGSRLLTGTSYMVAVDRVVVSDLLTNFTTALALLFSTFYVFNIEYPPGGSVTMEFIQR